MGYTMDIRAKDIVRAIEGAASLELAYSWDNSGFLCGDIEKKVRKVYITLDVNKYTVDEAVKAGADMIVSHHPIMFGGIKQIQYEKPQGYIIKQLIENNIALYAAHTSMDTANGGINDMLAEKLSVTDTDIIEKNDKYPKCGLGRIGKVKRTTLREFALHVKYALKTPFVRVCGNLDSVVECVAVGGGACDDIIPEALAMGADVMVTADMKYHISMDSVESGICVIDAGHFPTEVFVIDIFGKCLENVDVEIIKSTQKDVFRVIV